MSLDEQLADFNSYASGLVRDQQSSGLSLAEVYDRWWAVRHGEEDIAAIRASVEDYNGGERGRSAREELEEHRKSRGADRQP